MNNSAPQPSIADLKALIRTEARRVTSYDVAMAAGVSQSAVSRCFQPKASVSKATYARVMEAARDLDYTPNAAARSLNTRRSNLVAVVLSTQISMHYPEVLSELSRQFGMRGMRVLLFSLASESDIDHTLADIWQHQVDGVVVGAYLTAAQMAEFERRHVPFVLFNRHHNQGDAHAVACDHHDAARKMVTRLAAAGHRRFAMIDGPADSVVADERRRGVSSRLAEIGLAPPLVVSGAFDYASGGRGLREIVACLGGLPDAVICANDVMAIGCLDTARHDMRLSVPDDLSITGFDGIPQSGWMSYNLTTLRLPMQTMTLAVADLLSGLIRNGPRTPAHQLFSATVVDGATARLGPAS